MTNQGSTPEWITVFDNRAAAYDNYISMLESGSIDKVELVNLRNQAFNISSDVVTDIVDTMVKECAVDNNASRARVIYINEALTEFKNSSIRNRTRKDILTLDYDRLRETAGYEVIQ